MSDHQYDLEEAIAAKIAGEQLVAKNQKAEWRTGYAAHAETFLSALTPKTTFIGEDLRKYVEPIIGQPEHHNAWGALAGAVIRRWMKEKRIRSIGMAPMTRKASHARQTPQYEVLGD